MSHLPLPDFANVVPPFNPCGFVGWPIPGQGRSIFGRPPVSSLPFPSGFPVNSALPYSVPQIRPGFIRSTFTSIPANHVLPHGVRASGQFGPPQQRTATYQGKVTEQAKNYQYSDCQTEFSCDACQRQFTSRDTLNCHTDAHVKCSFDGCSFEATRKVLKLHWIQVHAEGKSRIKLDTPEEIEKWREERKRNYPTLANVQKKEDENLKRRESGQILKTRNFRYRRGQHGGREFKQGGRNHLYGRNLPRSRPKVQNGNIPTGSCKVQDKSITENKDQTTENKMKEESGEDPLSLVLEEHENGDKIRDSLLLAGKANCALENEEGSTVGSQVQSALNSLCMAYASDSDGGECDRNEEVNNREQNKSADIDRTATATAFNGAYKVNTNVRSIKEHKTGNRQWIQSRKAKPKAHSYMMRMRKPTLLEKLLAADIRHERNIILQCLRHIVKNSFFEVEGSQSF